MSAPPARRRQPRLVTGTFVRVMAANFFYFTTIGAITAVLPRYIDGPLGGSELAVGVGVGSFTVTALILRPFSGRFGDRYGRHLPIRAGLALHTAGLAVLLVASNLGLVVTARLITGIGEALFFVGASTVIQDLAPDDRRGEAASLFSLSLFGGLGVGPIVGETLLDATSYDAVWLFVTGMAAVGGLISLSIPDTRTDKGPHDAVRRIIHPEALRPGLILGAAVWGLAAFNTFIPLYALDLGLSGARLVFLTNAVVIFLIRSFGARIPDRVGPLRVARFALLMTPLGMAIMGLWPAIPALFVGAIFQATGQALAFPSLMSIAVNNAPATQRGSVMGTFTAFFDLSFGGGSVALGAVASVLGFRGAFLGAMFVAALGTMMVWFVPPPIKRPRRDVDPVIEIAPPGE